MLLLLLLLPLLLPRPLLFAVRTTPVPVGRPVAAELLARVKTLLQQLFTSATTTVAVKSSWYVLPTSCKHVLVAANSICYAHYSSASVCYYCKY